ncbi:MAG: type I DNA topoisomerase [Firmicutes bacterium]|nr:type I DNA topoisomerase [Bacillota bacterium]
MSKYLVVVESPTKAKTISKFLSKNYKVVSSMGHIRDLPKSKLGIDVENGFAPHYITIRGKGEMLKELKKSAKSVDKVLYAADPDREGEAIAWHLKQYLEGNTDGVDPNPDELCRIEFNEITKEAVKKAVKNPRAIDTDRFYAQQSRRILDRLVGYKISPLLWKKVRKGLSAGRVQSVAVRLVCERQDEIDAFIPEEYWTLDADFLHGESEFTAKLMKIDGKKAEIPNKEAMQTILSDLDGVKYSLTSVQKKNKKKPSPAPFTTSVLQQEANQKLNFTAKRTMQIAQQLYEGISIGGSNVGLITYMRTDSVRISEPAQTEALAYIENAYGKEYCPEKPKNYVSGNRAQDAHEAIRPTSVLRSPASIKESLSQPQYRLYKLIWERFVASQMADAQVLSTTYDIEAGKYLFRANGSIILFPGYTKLYKSDNKNDSLPEIAEGEPLELSELFPEQHFTQPPAAFTEATLIKTLEKLGIGRPSTYVTIIETIVARGYVSRKDKTFHPTELGSIVNELLMEHFPNILNVEFTSQMEEELDKVEEGQMGWRSVLEDFYGPFSESLEKAEEAIGEVELVDEVSDVVCEFCGRNMVYKIGRYGKFLACPGYPECRNVKSVDKDGNVEETTLGESEEVCEKCGRKMVLKKGRYGTFLACPGYPECKNVKSLDEEIGVACTECGGALVKKRNKRGRIFYGCKNYPDCQTAYWNLPVDAVCPDCGRHMVEKASKNQEKTIICENKECPSNQKVTKGKRGRKKANE